MPETCALKGEVDAIEMPVLEIVRRVTRARISRPDASHMCIYALVCYSCDFLVRDSHSSGFETERNRIRDCEFRMRLRSILPVRVPASILEAHRCSLFTEPPSAAPSYRSSAPLRLNSVIT